MIASVCLSVWVVELPNYMTWCVCSTANKARARLQVELICEKLQRRLKFRNLNRRLQEFTVKVELLALLNGRQSRCRCLYSTRLCPLRERVKMHARVSECVGSSWRRGMLWPGDNSDEWPRQVSNEALVTD